MKGVDLNEESGRRNELIIEDSMNFLKNNQKNFFEGSPHKNLMAQKVLSDIKEVLAFDAYLHRKEKPKKFSEGNIEKI